MSGDQLDLDALDELRAWVGNLDCMDSAPGSQWTCREGDGTGLWCESCLAAHQFDTLVAEVRRLRALPDAPLGWDSRQGVMVFTDVDTAQRVTLREWIDHP